MRSKYKQHASNLTPGYGFFNNFAISCFHEPENLVNCNVGTTEWSSLYVVLELVFINHAGQPAFRG